MSSSGENTPSDERIKTETAVITREEYLEKLRQWLDEARLWHGFCSGFPYYLNLQHQVTGRSQGLNFYNSVYQARPVLTNANFQNQNNIPVFRPGTYEFRIPPVWKRVIAEVLDFLILLLVKVILTFAVIETFYIVSIDNYRFDSFKKNLQDPKLAMQMSVEILMLELLHRFIVCCYEVYWLKGGMCATPGKRYMGLMVIHAESIVPVSALSDDVVRVSPCTPLGLQRSIIRAVLKNIFIGIMLPMCFTLYILRFNRTGYDTISNSLVVEYRVINQFQNVQ